MIKLPPNILKFGFGLGANGVGTLIGLITQVALARLMGAADYGLLALTLTTVLLPLKLCDFGVIAATHRFISVRIGEKRYCQIKTIIKKSGTFLAGIAFFMTGAFYVLASKLGVWFDIERMTTALMSLIFFIPFLYIQKWAFTVLKGLGNNSIRIFIETTIQNILIAVFSIGLWLHSASVYSALIGYGIAYTFTAFISCLAAVFYLSRIPEDSRDDDDFHLKDLIWHGLPVNIAALGQKLLSRGDIMVIGILLSETEVGFYKAAYTLASGIKIFASPIASYVAFYMGKAIGKKDTSKILPYYDLSILISLALTLPLYLVLFVFSHDIIGLAYTKSFAEATILLQILCIGFSIFICTGPMASLFNAIGKNWIRMWIVLGAGIANIILNITLISIIGLEGAALSTSLSFIFIYASFSLFIKFNREINGRARIDSTPILLVVLTFILGSAIYGLHLGTYYLEVTLLFMGSAMVFAISLILSYKCYKKLEQGTKIFLKDDLHV